jgi:hypothetical protein
MFAETRKGVPTNWAGTPDAHHLELPRPFAKPFSRQFPRKLPQNGINGRRRR